MKNSKIKQREGISPVVAGVAGAVIGAGAVVAGVAALRDEKNRAKAQKVLTQVKDQAKGYIKTLEKRANQMQGEAEDTIAQGKKEVKKIAKEAK